MLKVTTRFVGILAALPIGAPLVAGSATPASAGDAGSAVAARLLGGAVGVMVGAAAARPAPPPAVVYERPAPGEDVEPGCQLGPPPALAEAANPAGPGPGKGWH